MRPVRIALLQQGQVFGTFERNDRVRRCEFVRGNLDRESRAARLIADPIA